MKVASRTTALRKQYEHSVKAKKAYGRLVARKYIERVNILKAAKNQAEIMAQTALRCHALKGDRKGQYALLLHGRWRLIVTFHSGEIEIVRIEEVSKHYGD